MVELQELQDRSSQRVATLTKAKPYSAGQN